MAKEIIEPLVPDSTKAPTVTAKIDGGVSVSSTVAKEEEPTVTESALKVNLPLGCSRFISPRSGEIVVGDTIRTAELNKLTVDEMLLSTDIEVFIEQGEIVRSFGRGFSVQVSN